MPACPNCGRQTLRTKDWACQWCGYPLINRNFKKIDKTFKELQAERGMAAKTAGAEPDLEPEIDTEPLPEPEPPKPVYKPVSRPVAPIEPPLPPPALRPEPRIEPRPISQPPPLRPVVPPVTRPEPVTRALPEPINNPEQKPVVIPPASPIILPQAVPAQPAPEVKREVPPPPRPVIIPPPPVPEVKIEPTPPPVQPVPPPPPPAARIEPEPPPRPKPEIIIEAPQPVVPTIKLEAIRDGMEITADQIDELYRADKSGAHSKFAGKTITVRGKVEKVFIKDHLDVRYIVLTGNQKLASSIRCTFNQNESSKASRLNEGDDVAVRGKYDGYSKNIMFKECTIV
jgi:hypothetical protein